jgi:hypothetical protein
MATAAASNKIMSALLNTVWIVALLFLKSRIPRSGRGSPIGSMRCQVEILIRLP